MIDVYTLYAGQRFRLTDGAILEVATDADGWSYFRTATGGIYDAMRSHSGGQPCTALYQRRSGGLHVVSDFTTADLAPVGVPS